MSNSTPISAQEILNQTREVWDALNNNSLQVLILSMLLSRQRAMPDYIQLTWRALGMSRKCITFKILDTAAFSQIGAQMFEHWQDLVHGGEIKSGFAELLLA